MYINTSYKVLYNAATIANLSVYYISAIDEFPQGGATLYEFHFTDSSIIEIMEKMDLAAQYLKRRNRLVCGRMHCEYKLGKKAHWIVRVGLRLMQRGEL